MSFPIDSILESISFLECISLKCFFIQIRSIIIHGRDDHVFPLVGGNHLHQSLPNSKFIIVDSASHQVFEEHPKQVKDEIVRLIMDSQPT